MAKAKPVVKTTVKTPPPKAVSKPVRRPAPKNPKSTGKALAVQSHDVSPVTAKGGKKGKGLSLPASMDLTTPYAMLDAQFEALATKYEMIGGTNLLDRLSSGSLVLDLIHGGGFAPVGICQMLGEEACGKTTTILHTLGGALEARIPYCGINDAENTFDTLYMQNLLGTRFDPLLLERLKYSDQNLLENYLNYVRSIMRALPDKVWSEEAQSFVLRFDKSVKSHLALIEGMNRGGVTPDSKLSDRTFAVFPTENRMPQALIALDSFPALIASKSDDRDSGESGGMAEKARILAEELPKITGRLRRKGVVFLASNQLRERPATMFGSPWYEAGGNALRYNSGMRTWMATRAVPDGWRKDKESGALAVEDSPLGGEDRYSFKAYTNKKNKAGQPFLKGWARIWVGDYKGVGHGIDPVFDCFEYLKMTGQVSGARAGKKGFKLLLPKHKDLPPMTWAQFKLFILAEQFGGQYAKVLRENGFTKQPKIYGECRAQMMPRAGDKPKGVELRAAYQLLKSASATDDLTEE